MNEQFESLAQAIFDHDLSQRMDRPGKPTATWDEQNEAQKDRYRTAAMVSRLITLGPIYRIEMFQATTSENEADSRNPNVPDSSPSW